MQCPAAFLRSLFDTAVATALPENCLAPWIPERPSGRVIVVGAGKAAASMAAVLENKWQAPLEGVVVVPYGHGAKCRWVRILEAGHPVPDAAGIEASHAVMAAVDGLTHEDTVVCLLSGGGSSLLSLPAPGVTADEKRDINKQLLRSGAAIYEINAVLSLIHI